MFDGRGFDAAEHLVDDWQEGFERRAAQARELATRMAGLSAVGRSPDGLIEVTVGRSGELTGIRLDEETRRQPTATTEREILAAVTAARATLAEKAREAVDGTLGADSETGRAILAGYEAGHDGGRDAGHDGGRDAGHDGGRDAGHDGGRDAGHDGGRDAGHDDGRRHR